MTALLRVKGESKERTFPRCLGQDKSGVIEDQQEGQETISTVGDLGRTRSCSSDSQVSFESAGFLHERWAGRRELFTLPVAQRRQQWPEQGSDRWRWRERERRAQLLELTVVWEERKTVSTHLHISSPSGPMLRGQSTILQEE